MHLKLLQVAAVPHLDTWGVLPCVVLGCHSDWNSYCNSRTWMACPLYVCEGVVADGYCEWKTCHIVHICTAFLQSVWACATSGCHSDPNTSHSIHIWTACLLNVPEGAVGCGHWKRKACHSIYIWTACLLNVSPSVASSCRCDWNTCHSIHSWMVFLPCVSEGVALGGSCNRKTCHSVHIWMACPDGFEGALLGCHCNRNTCHKVHTSCCFHGQLHPFLDIAWSVLASLVNHFLHRQWNTAHCVWCASPMISWPQMHHRSPYIHD